MSGSCPVRVAFVAALLLLAAAAPSFACLETPANPPDVTVTGDACADGELVVTLHDYSTFAASSDFCSCALNLPLLYGVVKSADIVDANTGMSLSNFAFSSNNNANFGAPGTDWQGFSAAVSSAVGGIEVDLVFRVTPTEVRCDDFEDILQTALEDPPGGVLVGTGGASSNGTPNHHVSVQPAGTVTVPHQSNCPTELALSPCSIDLRSGEVSKACSMVDYYRILNAPTDSNGDDFLESVIQVDLGQRCERVCVVLDYGDDPQDWTFNIGDSITNNGYGGNSGGGEAEAEAQIKDHQFTTYSIGLGPGQVDRVASQGLALRDGGYKVCVSDQTITYGQSASRATTPFSSILYALPDPFDGNNQVFIGLNRVIHNAGGAPSGGRTGSGLLRAHVTID